MDKGPWRFELEFECDIELSWGLQKQKRDEFRAERELA